MGPVSTGIQSLLLLHQVMESRHSVSDRYYNALYAKLLDPALKHCNRQVSIGTIMYTVEPLYKDTPELRTPP